MVEEKKTNESFPGKVEGKVEFPGKVEGEKKFPGKVEGEKKEFPGKVEGKVEFPGKVEGEKKFPGKVEGKVEFPGKVEGEKKFPGKVEGEKKEIPGKVEGKVEFPGKVEGEKKELPGKVEGKVEFPGKVEGDKKELPGKVEGKVEFPGKVEGEKKFPGKVETEKKEIPGKVEGKVEFPGKVEGEKKELPGKVEGKVEFPGKVEGDKKEIPGKVETEKKELPGKVEGKVEFPGKVETEKKEFPGKVEKAPSTTESAPAKKPAEFVTFYNEAKRQFNSQDYEGALVNFNKAIDAIPENNSQMKTLIYSRGSCLKKLNRLEEAVADYTQCIALDDKYSRAYKARAGVYKAMDRLEEAIEDYSYCYLLDTISSGDMQMTPDGMDEVIQALSKRDAKAELKRRHEDKDYKRHLPSKQFIAFYFSTILSEKAAEYNPSKYSEQELTEFISKATPEGEVTLGDYLLMRGGLYKAEQRYTEAMDDFLEAAKEENHCHSMADACLEAATFLSLSGDTLEGLKYYEKVYPQKEKRSVNLLVKYASCLLEQEDDRYHAVFDEACTSFPTECDGFFHRGQVMYIENKTEEAIRVGEERVAHA